MTTDADANAVRKAVQEARSRIVRGHILDGEPRIDGRDTRPSARSPSELGVLPRAHGSALFTRGETQALVVATLGTGEDEQIIDALHGEYRELHAALQLPALRDRRSAAASARPSGVKSAMARLARRALHGVLPSAEDFPYTIRVVSEITESNGSSSMACVCGASLALMDAGVPLKAHVAGIAMGLIKEGNALPC